MEKKSGKFSAENQPSKYRSKAFKTRFLETIRKEALLGIGPDATKTECEEQVMKRLVDIAFGDNKDYTNQERITVLKTIIERCYAPLKATMDTVNFEFDENQSYPDQIQALVKAISDGLLAPDVAALITNIIRGQNLEEFDEIKDRIDQLEKISKGE